MLYPGTSSTRITLPPSASTISRPTTDVDIVLHMETGAATMPGVASVLSSLGYVLLAFIARFALHERVSVTRWLGIVLVSSGVGFVTSGPEVSRRPPQRMRDGTATERS